MRAYCRVVYTGNTRRSWAERRGERGACVRARISINNTYKQGWRIGEITEGVIPRGRDLLSVSLAASPCRRKYWNVCQRGRNVAGKIEFDGGIAWYRRKGSYFSFSNAPAEVSSFPSIRVHASRVQSVRKFDFIALPLSHSLSGLNSGRG